VKFLPTLVALFLISGPLLAQVEVARRHIEAGLEAAAAGDTARALREFRRAIDAEPDLAEAYYQYGRFKAKIASFVEGEFADRLAAAEALEEAIRLDPDNPLYLSEFGILRIKQMMRNDGERVLRRALESARSQPVEDSAMLADAYYNLGYAEEVRFENQRGRRFNSLVSGPMSVRIPGTQRLSRYVEDYLESNQSIPGFGGESQSKMLEHYRTALRYRPGHWEASRRLLVHLYDTRRFAEYLVVARRLQTLHPDRSEAYLYEGLGLHAAGREDEAGIRFDSALARMPEWDREAFRDLEPIMRRDPAAAYLSLSEPDRIAFEDSYWRFSDPLYLTEANERRLEHLSRVAYADLRFSEPSTGLRGWQTDRGIIYIRYGPPDVFSSFRARNGVRKLWVYQGGVVFMFFQPAGYFHSRFAGRYEYIASEVRHAQPAKYDNIPSIPALYPVDVQIARFRGESPDWIAVEVHAAIPFERLLLGQELQSSEIETGLFLLNARGERIVQQAQTRLVQYGDAGSTNPIRSWRLMLPATGKLVAAVEARDDVSWYAAAARDTFTAGLFPADSLAVSDILLAEMIRPLADEPSGRAEFEIAPNPSTAYAPLQPVHLYYELYGLERDAQGFGSYEVQLTVRVARLHRGGGFAEILGDIADAWGFTIVGDDRVELRFSREVDLSDLDRVTEYLSLDLQTAPPGSYEITVKILDRLAGTLASRQRAFTVVEDG
jgi:GWxTD domain-containing protein